MGNGAVCVGNSDVIFGDVGTAGDKSVVFWHVVEVIDNRLILIEGIECDSGTGKNE